jgi:hypothetical protein
MFVNEGVNMTTLKGNKLLCINNDLLQELNHYLLEEPKGCSNITISLILTNVDVEFRA